jgi:hypothetical protein
MRMSDCTSVQKRKCGVAHGWACLLFVNNDVFVHGDILIWTIDWVVDE